MLKYNVCRFCMLFFMPISMENAEDELDISTHGRTSYSAIAEVTSSSISSICLKSYIYFRALSIYHYSRIIADFVAYYMARCFSLCIATFLALVSSC